MKLRFLVSLGFILIFMSCGSNKNISSRRSSRVVLKHKPKYKRNKNIIQNKKIVKKPLTVNSKNTLEYIERFAPIAIKKMKEFKIPASITLAQGILESGSGRSELATRSNNHFGIKCHKGWEGKSVTHDDDAIGECFRKYVHPETSYEDHSKFLITRSRYSKLFKLKSTDYRGWAYGLKRAGYATDPRYPKKLINLIKKYNLHKYDLNVYPKSKVYSKTRYSKNRIHKVVKGDTLYAIARKYNVSVNVIKKRNNLKNNNLKIGQKLILN